MKGKTARKLPEIKACPCGELRCGLVERTHADTEKLVGYFVISECGWIGPTRKTKSGAILAWNRRAPDADAERRGAPGADRGGRHAELGGAIFLGKPVILVGSPEHVFHRHPLVTVVACKTDMARKLREMTEFRQLLRQ